MSKGYKVVLAFARLLALSRGLARNLGHFRPLASSAREEACSRRPPSCFGVDAPAMDHDSDDQARSEHHGSDAETAVARCQLDCLLGRVLPADDHLGALFDSLDQGGAKRQSTYGEAEQHVG
jgi:hypothetical protein